MTPAEIAALNAPLSEEEPCGPDLDMLGDPDYMRFTARIDAVLPKTFASFDRASIDFPAEFATLKALLAKSRDLRLLAPLAKLHILNRDLAGYAAVFKLIEELIDGAWPAVVPGLIDGDAVLRVVTLQTLDDMADSVMPLQAAPLFETRRFGKVSYRTHLLASGLIQPRAPQNDGEEGEEVPSASAVNGALAEADVTALIAARTRAIELQESLGRIEALLGEKSGQPGALTFDRLKPLVRDIGSFLDKSVAQRDPSLGLATAAPSGTSDSATEAGADADVERSGAPARAVGAIQSTAQAQGALAAAAAYFAQSEPSSPILMLISQAQALVGRNFFEVMQALLPDEASKARLRVGQEPGFVMYLERLASLSVGQAESTEEAPPSDEVEQSEEAAQSEEAEPGADQSEAAEAGSNGGEEPAPAVAAPAPASSEFHAADRRGAMALLQQVGAHFRRTEPSSPIPLLLERAEGIVGRDFFGLLRETLPAESLKVDEPPG